MGTSRSHLRLGPHESRIPIRPPDQGRRQALDDGFGDCEELTSLFVAMCRAAKSPPGACGSRDTATRSSTWKMTRAKVTGIRARPPGRGSSARCRKRDRSCKKATTSASPVAANRAVCPGNPDRQERHRRPGSPVRAEAAGVGGGGVGRRWVGAVGILKRVARDERTVLH